MGNHRPPLPAFASRLCLALLNKGWCAMDLTRATGLHNNTILSYLTGKSEPHLQRLLILCNALSVTPNFLLGFSPQLLPPEDGGEK